jgi:hypothetical protein
MPYLSSAEIPAAPASYTIPFIRENYTHLKNTEKIIPYAD